MYCNMDGPRASWRSAGIAHTRVHEAQYRNLRTLNMFRYGAAPPPSSVLITGPGALQTSPRERWRTTVGTTARTVVCGNPTHEATFIFKLEQMDRLQLSVWTVVCVRL